jgi:hypothetical protein
MATHVAPAPQQADIAVSTSRRRFVGHYLEMVAVMMVSMMLLGGLFWGAMALLGHGDLRHYVGVRAFVMTVNMVVGMTLWMRVGRGHGWASTLEMGAAMVLPFVLLIGPYWAGLLSAEAFLGLEHLLMLPFMLLVMLRRYEEYAGAHDGHHHGSPDVPAARPAG